MTRDRHRLLLATMDSWQTLAVQVRLDKLAVYHAPRGKAPRLLGGDIAVSTTMNTNALRLGVSGQSGFRFDSVSVHARSLDAAKSTTYAYNTSNQLTSSVTDGTTTSYTYDAWGRLLTRTAGTATASYIYRYGDKLKRVLSSFPGDTADMAYNYDGLGRRRNRMANGVPPVTWWRYGLGSNILTSYVDSDLDWVVEGFSSVHVPGLAEIRGINPATGVGHFYALDNSMNMRSSFSQSKGGLSAFDYYPFGKLYSSNGAEENLPEHRQEYAFYDKYINMSLRGAVGEHKGSTEPEGQWTIGDFILWYAIGNGAPVDLNSVGVTEKARKHIDVINGVKKQKRECDNEAARKAREACMNTTEEIVPFRFSHSNMHFYFMWEFSVLVILGKGYLHGKSICKGVADCCERSYVYGCNHTFLFADYFDGCLDAFTPWDAEPGFPYKMYGSFEEMSWGSGRF